VISQVTLTGLFTIKDKTMRPGPLMYACVVFFVLSIGSIAADDGKAKFARPYMVGCLLAGCMAAACKED
jgi:hypothetical protein